MPKIMKIHTLLELNMDTSWVYENQNRSLLIYGNISLK